MNIHLTRPFLRAILTDCDHGRNVVIAVNEGETHEELRVRATSIQVKSSCRLLEVQEISFLFRKEDHFIPSPENSQNCPEGTVLIDKGGEIHPDEPAFCIEKTEVTQLDDRRFWEERKQQKPQPGDGVKS
ncbi:MAG: hypothetical protein A3I05_00745 [Deltaproteobacteria bacterium RIFCSPLOWO2_02_FULL_44_10]|nr:MAG: hypothetical protein A3C46_06635 [Deltaproteobacteria bacterium RIFCSPHIGHO2_02_FULL_44_16]OGQ46493.1 MAG: hypothetical protein A3I05_00745 [Deltaproteobacteria bacterium RIFCSPLOWO2_02_FULL_44_10]